MTMTKLQWVAGVVAVSGLLTVGGVWATGQAPGLGPAEQRPAAGAPQAAGAPEKPPASAERQAGSSQRRKSLNNLKQIMLAIHNHNNAYNYLPADIRDKDGKPLLSWRIAILPFLEQDNLYKQFKLDEPWDSEHNLKLLAHMPAVFRVGIEPKDATHTYYQVFAGPNTPLHLLSQSRLTFASISDGTSNTLGVVEAGPPVPWTKPADIPFDPTKPVKLAGPFANEWHAATMDGAAFAFKRNIAPDVLRRLIVMNDGEPANRIKDLLAPRLAESLEDKVQLGMRIAENQRLIERINQLMKEHVELLAGQNGQAGDLGAAEEMADRLKQIVNELAAMNKKLQGTPGTKRREP